MSVRPKLKDTISTGNWPSLISTPGRLNAEMSSGLITLMPFWINSASPQDNTWLPTFTFSGCSATWKSFQT
ncbi:hypothetical protein D3C81_1377280 [compost metagenome]